MKKLVIPAVIAVLALSGCHQVEPSEAVAQVCSSKVRYEIEQNVDGTTEEWLAYDMETELHLVEAEEYEGGAAYTFDGIATLTAENLPSKTVDFTCFGNKREDTDRGSAAIMTINGNCTKSRIEDGYCS